MIRKLLSHWTDGPISAGVLLAFGCVIAFAPDPFVLMIVRSFMWQWALLLLAVSFLALCTRRWWSAMGGLVAAVLLMFPADRTAQVDPVAGGRELLRVAQMNVFQPNDDHADVIAAALASDADVISFQEVNPVWAQALLEGLGVRYPFHKLVTETNCYGIALFSRLPLLRIDVLPLERRSMLCAEVSTPAGPMRLFSVHATSPGSYSHFRERNAQLDRLAEMVKASPMPVVLVGDLNAVSWDHALVRLCERAGLREHGDGVRPTWPSYAGLALIPLDHILVTGQLAVSGLGAFSISGSDHRGIAATIRSRS